MKANVRILEPTINTYANYSNLQTENKKKVAAYARVSTEQDEQQNSYEAQVNYYKEYISSRPDWQLVDIYSDEGISGTNTKKRDGFNKMMAAARNGEIDIILTKSISRFARNTVDTLKAVRELKALNISVYFEKENIDSLDSKGEMMLTIFSSLAQEESRSISENVRWGKQRSMQKGVVNMPYKHFLGYRKGEDGKPEIVEEEAEIVKYIYESFLNGNSIRYIANDLTNKSIPTPAGKTNWAVSTIRSILSNEKYMGDAILQKQYVEDFLTKKIKKNEGELPKYYVKNSHPAIISKDVFALAQIELERRYINSKSLSFAHVFSDKLICESCGKYYGRKRTHGGKYVWYCNHRYSKDKRCNTPIIHESLLKNKAAEAISKYLNDLDIEAIYKKLESLKDISNLEKEKQRAEDKLQEELQKIEELIDRNSSINSISSPSYDSDYEEQLERVNLAKEECARLDRKILETRAMREKLRRILSVAENTKEDLTIFNEKLFKLLVFRINVTETGELKFVFKDEKIIRIKINAC